MICWSSPSRPTRSGSGRTRSFSTSPCRRRTWLSSTRWIAPRAPARHVTPGGAPCGAPARSSRFGGLLERGSEPGPDVLGYLLRAQVDQGLAPDAFEVGGVAAVDRLRVRPAEHLEHDLVAVLVRVRP